MNISRPLFLSLLVAGARGFLCATLRCGLVLFVFGLAGLSVLAEPIHPITIDGTFQDWVDVPSRSDPVDDTHDTNHDGPFDVPVYVQHEDVDLVEFKFTHDEENVYAYFRATGVIGRT